MKSLVYFDDIDFGDWPEMIAEPNLKWSTVNEELEKSARNYTIQNLWKEEFPDEYDNLSKKTLSSNLPDDRQALNLSASGPAVGTTGSRDDKKLWA